MVNLETTNWLLGVMAIASAVQTLLLVGVAVVGWRLYRQVSTSVQEIESATWRRCGSRWTGC